MIELIERNRSQVTELCRRFHVNRLEVFGSAGNGKFDPSRSDLDFLVGFDSLAPSAHSKAYFDLWFALEDLFGRKVDLVETRAATNPYFLRMISQNRRSLFAA